jgi:four helix bundle protein
MGDFKKLKVWGKAHALMLNVDRVAVRIRRAQYRGIRKQLTDAAESVPSNLVEGSGKKSNKDFARFVGYSFGSARELEYHLITCRDLKLISRSDFQSLVDQVIEVRRMLTGLRRYLDGDDAEE